MIVIAMLLASAAPEWTPDCEEMPTQADMTQCAVNDYREADAALNRQWRLTMQVMRTADRERLDRTYDKRPGYAATLLEGQRAWLKFRDAQCTLEGYYMKGGSAEPMVENACKAQETKDRTKELRILAELFG